MLDWRERQRQRDREKGRGVAEGVVGGWGGRWDFKRSILLPRLKITPLQGLLLVCLTD